MHRFMVNPAICTLWTICLQFEHIINGLLRLQNGEMGISWADCQCPSTNPSRFYRQPSLHSTDITATRKAWLTPVVYSTDRPKAVVPVLVLLFVALWFILQGDLFWCLTLCHFVLVFFSPFSIAITSLGEEELILVLFVRLFALCLFGFVGFLFLLVSGKGCGLWLWHSLDFSLTFCFY